MNPGLTGEMNFYDDKKVIKTVGNPRYRIKEDSLRILRAIRFASVLDFEIDRELSDKILLIIGIFLKENIEELNKEFEEL